MSRDLQNLTKNKLCLSHDLLKLTFESFLAVLKALASTKPVSKRKLSQIAAIKGS